MNFLHCTVIGTVLFLYGSRVNAGGDNDGTQ